jgi:hypothetical protein
VYHVGMWWNGIHGELKPHSPYGVTGSNPVLPTSQIFV